MPAFADIIKAEMSTIVLKAINGLIKPVYLLELFTKCSENNHMNLSNTQSYLRTSLMRSKNCLNSFSYRAAGLWNQLSSDAKMVPSFGIFKDYKGINTACATLSFNFSFYLETY